VSPPRLPKKDPPKPKLGRALVDSTRYVSRALGMVWRASPPLTIALTLITLGHAAVAPSIVLVGKRIVDAVVAGTRDDALRWVAVELALVVGQALLQRGNQLVNGVLGSRLGVDINVMILDRARQLELRHFEDPDFYDRLTRARREASSRPLGLVLNSFALFSHALKLVGYAALLVRFEAWVVLALMVAVLPGTVAEMRYAKEGFRMRNWRSPDSRKALYFEHVLANDSYAKEVKLFGLGDLFLGRYRELAERFHREDTRLALRRTLITFLASLLATGTYYGAYASMAVMAAAGRISLGDLTMYVLAFRNGQQTFQDMLGCIASIYESNLYMSNLFAFLDASIASAVTRAPSAADAPVVERGIRLSGVIFKYPGQEKPVLDGIDLFIPRGQSIALVGQNGAGKTTLVKLVTRLYDPTEGRVLLDGKDLRDWDHAELLARFGVIFQDFNRYQLRVRENVGVGKVDRLDDEPLIARAVERGGAEGVVAGLSSGVETQLGRWFEDGAELSGGQWQKLALARGFMREEADVLVLDEPTAALDAEAEHAVFQRFKELAAGRTTIIISHRFPTVRMADRILVLEHGKIVEDGTHDELLAAAKTYARLYKMQAEGYA
jgi:ATP-binding cassette subfamily B protein